MWDAHIILIVLAVACWLSAAIGRPFPAPYGIGWLGLAFYGISLMVR